MSMQVANVFVPPPVATPRAAEFIASAVTAPWLRASVGRVSHLVHSIWGALTTRRPASAGNGVRTLADRFACPAEFAQPLCNAIHYDANH
jgi:hypothetical protein